MRKNQEERQRTTQEDVYGRLTQLGNKNINNINFMKISDDKVKDSLDHQCQQKTTHLKNRRQILCKINYSSHKMIQSECEDLLVITVVNVPDYVSQ